MRGRVAASRYCEDWMVTDRTGDHPDWRVQIRAFLTFGPCIFPSVVVSRGA